MSITIIRRHREAEKAVEQIEKVEKVEETVLVVEEKKERVKPARRNKQTAGE